MSIHHLMHPRNPYKTRRPNFKELALKYPEFRAHAKTDLKGIVHLDFKEPECQRALSWALLKDDFDLDVDMPLDRLVPTIPLRLNYILWLEDILESHPGPTIGIDIGAGSACVYGLLSAKKNDWTMLTSETDAMNFEYAKRNIQKNSLDDKVKVVKVEEDTGLFDLIDKEDGSFAFCMCNPPFYANNLEAWSGNTRKDTRPEPNSVSTASPVESIVPGGEVNFVKRLIDDSLLLKTKVRVYTSMLGKKTSLVPLKEHLLKNEIHNFAQTEFCQGRTMRWGLAWTFYDDMKFPKPPSKVLKKKAARPPIVHKIPGTMENHPELEYSIPVLGFTVMSILDELKILYEPEKSTTVEMKLQIVAVKNTWSHQRRKRRQQRRSGEEPNKIAKTSEDKQNEHASIPDSTATNGSESKEQETTVVTPTLSSVTTSDSPSPAAEPTSEPKKEAPEEKTAQLQKNDDKPAKEEVTLNKDKISLSEATGSASQSTSDSASNVPDDLDLSIEDVTDYLCKCHLSLTKDADDILLEMTWIDGSNVESMYQLMQYFKNTLK